MKLLESPPWHGENESYSTAIDSEELACGIIRPGVAQPMGGVPEIL